MLRPLLLLPSKRNCEPSRQRQNLWGLRVVILFLSMAPTEEEVAAGFHSGGEAGMLPEEGESMFPFMDLMGVVERSQLLEVEVVP
jgi:hypothetical protein